MFLFRRFNRKAISLLAIILGVICLFIGGGWSIYSYHLTHSSLRAAGHITQLIEGRSRSETYYYPVFTYADQHGMSHTIRSSVGSSPVNYQVGDAVSVLYSPGREDNAHLDDWMVLWGIPILIAVLGGVYLPVGLVVYFWPRISARWKMEKSG